MDTEVNGRGTGVHVAPALAQCAGAASQSAHPALTSYSFRRCDQTSTTDLLQDLAQQGAADEARPNEAQPNGHRVLVEAAVHRAQRLDCRADGMPANRGWEGEDRGAGLGWAGLAEPACLKP